jgi:hypothetical protein
MPPAARNPFKKGFLDLPKLLLQGACSVMSVMCVITLFPAGTRVDSPLREKLTFFRQRRQKMSEGHSFHL